eukprot:scaffold236_cov164-Ochromonas_danica.AAC.15
MCLVTIICLLHNNSNHDKNNLRMKLDPLPRLAVSATAALLNFSPSSVRQHAIGNCAKGITYGHHNKI